MNDHRSQTGCTFEECAVCQDLAKLEQKIQAAEEILRNLAQERIALKTKQNGSHSGFIRQLPSETISEIFLLVDGPIDYSSTDKRNPAFPENYVCARALLSGVCHRWREIALGLPQLWSKAYINVCRKADELTKEWLNRSRPLRLNLTLYAFEDYKSRDWSCHSYIAPLFDLLRSHSARWGYVNIECAPDYTLHRLFNNLDFLPESHPFHLRLGGFNDGRRVSLRIPLQLGRFYSTVRDYTVDVLPFGWSNLTCLELQHYATNSVLEVMRQAPKLNRCILRSMYQEKEDPAKVTEIQPVVFKFLEYLELTFASNGAHFLKHLTLPSLQYLKCDLDIVNKNFSNASHSNESDVHELGNLLARSEISPTSLETFDLGYHASSWPESNSMWFQEIRDRVTHLSIDTRPGNSNALDSFLRQASDITASLPRLQELRLRTFQGLVSYQPGQYHGDFNDGGVLTPSMDSTTCAALCDFIVQLNLAININRHRETSSQTTTDNSAPNLNPTDLNEGHYRRSLKSIAIRSLEYHGFFLKMTRDTLSRLRDAQKNGPLKLEISSEGQDVLQDRQRVKEIGDGFILLK